MKKIAILGGGESGVGTAILAQKMGYDTFVSDKGIIGAAYKELLQKNDIDFEEGIHTESKILDADVVMKSPGIPEKVALVQKLIQQNTPVISEMEFAGQFTKANIVGITGSNGKTTTTLLTHHIVKNGGLNVGIAGNIGDSFAEQVAEKDYENYVLEISSFQLDGVQNFNSHIAILTNITPDHLDRYNYDFSQYVASKFRITMNQSADDFFIYDADDPAIAEGLTKHKTNATLVPFSLEKELDYGAYIKDNYLITTIQKEIFKMPLSTLSLKGKHNTKNAMAATLAAQLLKVRNETIKESLANFEGAEHRLEFVSKREGVEYINDSKATNVNATYYALECMDKQTVWIVGGVDKGNDYLDLMPLVREKVKAIVCLGLDNEKIKQTFGKVVDVLVETAGAEEAVKVSRKIAERGDAVLLSPACASFDLFKNYEDRGNQFKEAVNRI
ncbi:MAG: UDP-N-acetylmuramoyl-L-alanine--D-glutamate ligase [Flavobacteriaceae bacterium]|nr:UDP-N-acetylmuramoyl-L-alanine--D-glutamate ligase [Flavobacteriaceae bacterium]